MGVPKRAHFRSLGWPANNFFNIDNFTFPVEKHIRVLKMQAEVFTQNSALFLGNLCPGHLGP